MVRVHLRVNGVEYDLDVKPNERLLDTLRYRLGLMSVKEGCGRGECGACIVLVNGNPRNSCLTLTVSVDGMDVTTLEGLAPQGKIHAIQVAFIESDGIQCGFCTPGFIMMAKALLDRNPDPGDEEIAEWLGGNLCRCGSYPLYFKAVRIASEYIRKGRVLFDLEEIRRKYYLKIKGGGSE